MIRGVGIAPQALKRASRAQQQTKRQIPANARTGGFTPAAPRQGQLAGLKGRPAFVGGARQQQAQKAAMAQAGRGGFGHGRAAQRFQTAPGRPPPDAFGGRTTGRAVNPRMARRLARGRRFR